MSHPPAIIRAPRGPQKTCKTWAAEAASRMLQNNLDPDVAEQPANLVVYGGIGRAARNWDCYRAILHSLRNLECDETLLVQSGKPVGILPSHPDAPRVLIANSNLVPRWATWQKFHELDVLGLIMFGQMTAGSWIYIGTQGILQGTYETFAACGRKHFGAGPRPLLGRIVVTAGLGGMGGAQPLAAKLAGAVSLCIEVDPAKLQRRLETGYLDEVAESIPAALATAQHFRSIKEPRSIAVCANAGSALAELFGLGFVPDLITDQTSAHDPLHGYVPHHWSLEETARRRQTEPDIVIAAAERSIAAHVELLLRFQRAGSIVFEYGNNLRDVASRSGVSGAFLIPGFVPEFIRPLFCEGSGPFRWVALSGDPADIAATDEALLHLLPENDSLQFWLRHGAPHIKFQGLPARICWLRYGEREQAGVLFNRLVRDGKLKAPIVIGRDHLDCGSVASPFRETEGMRDGSDAVSDWPFLNAMINAVNGASWVSIHQGGGVGMGLSQHAGMVIVADGSEDAERRLRRVLASDPGIGILRHADAGYPAALAAARKHNLRVPMCP